VASMTLTASTTQAESLNASLRKAPRFTVSSIEEAAAYEDIFARHSYGRLIIWGYLLLLGAIIFVPLIVLLIIGGGSSGFLAGLSAIKDFTTSMFAGLAGLSGLAGLVIGRHFPATREQPKRRSPRKNETGPSR
jgi:hypothetical protein